MLHCCTPHLNTQGRRWHAPAHALYGIYAALRSCATAVASTQQYSALLRVGPSTDAEQKRLKHRQWRAMHSTCSNSPAEEHCQWQDPAPLAPRLCFEPFLPPAIPLKHTWFGSGGRKTQLETCWEQSSRDLQLPGIPQRPCAERAARLPLHRLGPHLSRLAGSARAGRPGCLCPAGHARLQRVRHCVGAGRHVGPVRAPVGLVQRDNALDESIMEWCGRPEAAGITVNLAWLAAEAGRAGMRSFWHLSRDKPYSLANSKSIAVQTWPASHCERGQHRPANCQHCPANTASVALRTWPASPSRHRQHRPANAASITLQTLPASPSEHCQHLPANAGSAAL